ncbi:hypothetical protein BT93_C0974 [Corymbia citriodora subsp. variegata]|nr:hypothetical protein BT93_C0974 [Corymbia citriodora subsp. variegata]
MAEWSKAPDSSSGPRERAWVQIPLLTIPFVFFSFVIFFSFLLLVNTSIVDFWHFVYFLALVN